ncbi:MAG: VOC family protein [Calditrichaceae bacterium]
MGVDANPVGWFEIPVTDMDRAKKFYESVFGFEIAITKMNGNAMGWFPTASDVIGAGGTLIKGNGYVPSSENGVMIYFTAPDMDINLKRIKDNGGNVLMGRTSIGEHGFIAIFIDSEGNRLALHSRY